MRVFEDSGRSGLRIDGRDGLKALMHDVQSGTANFKPSWPMMLAVGDDSRTRMKVRITNTFAHGPEFEFIIARSSLTTTGVLARYCSKTSNASWQESTAESFRSKCLQGNATSSNTVFSPGGGPAGFGLRRLLIDEGRNPKGELGRGDRKSLQTDRVVLTRLRLRRLR
jgi:hypothetical protein